MRQGFGILILVCDHYSLHHDSDVLSSRKRFGSMKIRTEQQRAIGNFLHNMDACPHSIEFAL